MKSNYCESCQINKIIISKEGDDFDGPSYLLCGECYKRLENFALRPLEYFNLKAIHGETNLLDYDFYDENTGEALEPEMDVLDAEDFPFPSLQDVKDNMERLIDYAIVQEYVDDNVIFQLQQHDKTEILNSISERLERNHHLGRRLMHIVGYGVGDFAAEWVRQYWRNDLKNDYRVMAVPLARCLPFDEAFGEILNAIEKTNNKLYFSLKAFSFFEKPEVLDWIETMKDQIKANENNLWGELASLSKLDWARTKKWLDSGQPLSSVALFALLCCITIDPEDPNPFFGNRPAKLLNPAKLEVIAHALNDCAEKDPSADVKWCVQKIINNMFEVAE